MPVYGDAQCMGMSSGWGCPMYGDAPLSNVWGCPMCGDAQCVGMSNVWGMPNVWGCPMCGDAQCVGMSNVWGCLMDGDSVLPTHSTFKMESLIS